MFKLIIRLRASSFLLIATPNYLNISALFTSISGKRVETGRSSLQPKVTQLTSLSEHVVSTGMLSLFCIYSLLLNKSLDPVDHGPYPVSGRSPLLFAPYSPCDI